MVEYAVWVICGLWGALFAGHPLVKGAGLLLIVMAFLRAFTERAAPLSSVGPPPLKAPDSRSNPESS